MISYKPLFKTMIDKDVTREQLRMKADIAPGTMSKIYTGRPVAYSILEKICFALGVPIQDVIAVLPDKKDESAGGGSSPSKKKGAGLE